MMCDRYYNFECDCEPDCKLMSPIYIQLRWTTKGWIAIFQGGTMPQNIPLPLPYTVEASARMVRRDFEARFPQARIEVQLEVEL
jgi:hypothetical protein